MASTDAKPVPQKNVAYRVTFPILDADGDLVTGASGLDSEVSKDGGTFADCTNEATEIATSSGVYYLDLTSTEMNADTVAIIVKTSTSGAKTTTIVMYPEEAGDIRVNVTAYGGTAGTFSGGRPEVNTTHAAGTAWGSGAITAASIAADAIGASELSADAVTEIANTVWALDATGNIYSRIGAPVGASISADIAGVQSDTDNIQTRIPAALVSGRIDASVGAMASGVLTATAIAADAITAAKVADGTIDAATFAAGAIDAAALAASAGTEIAAAVAAQAVTACTAVPAANGTIGVVLGYILAELRNLKTLNRTTGVETLKQDDGSANIGTRTVSDDGTTFTRPELA